MDKVPSQHAFLDVSDYARPVALWLARRLAPTPLTSVHVTLLFTLVGGAAAALFALDMYLPVAAVLLLAKNTLDALDGSLARARRRPSRVGRFLDSICDFVVTVAVFCGIAVGDAARHGADVNWWLAVSAILFATLQCSVFSYYYVRYRAQVNGDTTSAVNEREAGGYSWDHPWALAVTHRLYRLIYGWQDRLMDRLDRVVAGAESNAPLSPQFLSATTVLGLGTQLLVMALCALANSPVWALWLFTTAFNAYWLALLLVRRFTHSHAG